MPIRTSSDSGTQPTEPRCYFSILEVVGIYAAVIALAAIVKGVLGLVVGRYLDSDYATLIALDLSLVTILGFMFKARPCIFQTMSFRISAKTAFFAIGAGIIAANLSLFAGKWAVPLYSAPTNIAYIIRVIIAAPLLEELFFRGILLESLSKTIPTGIALLVSSLAFASFHTFFWIGMIGGFTLGLTYLLAQRSLSAVIIAHMTANILVNLPIARSLYSHFLAI